MGLEFTADEILALAEQIERNGAAFYRLAAERLPAARTLLTTLAGQEDEHLAFFSGLRRQLEARLREPVTYDPEGQAELYLKAMADRQVFPVGTDPRILLGDASTRENLLGIAARLEKDSIVFYTGLKAVAPAALVGNRLDAIIREEWKHLAFLGQLAAAR